MSKLKKKTMSRRVKKAAPLFREFQETALDRVQAAPPKEPMSRLEARIPASLYEIMECAARLRGLTLTAYVTATMGEDARRTIEEADIIRLSRADQVAFAKVLIDPPAPNVKLLAAKRRHAELTRK